MQAPLKLRRQYSSKLVVAIVFNLRPCMLEGSPNLNLKLSALKAGVLGQLRSLRTERADEMHRPIANPVHGEECGLID